MNTYLFTGTITTREPLACSPPGHLDRNGRALLPRMPVLTAAGPLETVYLPGSTIRGRYRHACADLCLERERPVTFARYLEVTVGGVRGSAEARAVDLRARADFLAREPLLSLFGAGASPIGWIHGRLDVGAALPAEPAEAMVLRGSRGDANSDPVLLDVLDETERERLIRGRAANRRRSRAAAEARRLGAQLARAKGAGEDTAELARALEAARRGEHEAASEQCALLGTDVSELLPLPGYEALPAGTVLGHRMFCRHVTEPQMSLLTAGLARFAEDPRFGAHRAHGCGRAGVAYEVKRLDAGRARPVGTVSIDPDRWDRDERALVVTGEPADWLEAWHDAAP